MSKRNVHYRTGEAAAREAASAGLWLILTVLLAPPIGCLILILVAGK